MPKLELHTLRWNCFQSLLALAQCGSQSAASARLGCAQPTVRNHVLKLEAWIGEKLGHGYSPYILTETGRELVRIIKRSSKKLKRHLMNEESSLSDFKLEWISVFYIMRKYKSQYKSMDALKLSQSDISRKTKELERWLGFSLFKRTGGWETTDFGERFLLTSDRIMYNLSRFANEVEQKRLDNKERSKK